MFHALRNHRVGNPWAAELGSGRTIDEVGDRLDGDLLGHHALAGTMLRPERLRRPSRYRRWTWPCAASDGPVRLGVRRRSLHRCPCSRMGPGRPPPARTWTLIRELVDAAFDLLRDEVEMVGQPAGRNAVTSTPRPVRLPKPGSCSSSASPGRAGRVRHGGGAGCSTNHDHRAARVADAAIAHRSQKELRHGAPPGDCPRRGGRHHGRPRATPGAALPLTTWAWTRSGPVVGRVSLISSSSLRRASAISSSGHGTWTTIPRGAGCSGKFQAVSTSAERGPRPLGLAGSPLQGPRIEVGTVDTDHYSPDRRAATRDGMRFTHLWPPLPSG